MCVCGGGGGLVLVLLCSTKYPFLICNHLAGEKRAGCFFFKCLLDVMYIAVSVMCFFLMVP